MTEQLYSLHSINWMEISLKSILLFTNKKKTLFCCDSKLVGAITEPPGKNTTRKVKIINNFCLYQFMRHPLIQ